MIKLVPVSQLRLGMYIHNLNCGWLQHNFLRRRFSLDSEDLLARVQALGVDEVFIDIRRGIDVAPAEKESDDRLAPEPREKAPAPVARPSSSPATPAERRPHSMEQARRLHGEATSIVRDMMGDVRLGKQLDIEKVEPLVEGIVDSIFRRQDALLPLSRLKDHDQYTFQHSVSVCALMVSFARTLELPRETIREIAIGALLHDVGKAKIPESILNKPAKLTDAEFARMKNHVVQSKIILQATGGISQIALDVAAQHHERFDGSGYPNRLQGDGISLYGQMGAIVDVYDAITSNRVYHRGMPAAEGLRKLLSWSNGHFQPQLVQAFIRAVGIYPSGSLVRLASGRLAVVQAQHEDAPLKPLVKAVFHSKGHYLQPTLIDLRRSQDQIVSDEDFAAWKIDPEMWLPE